MVRTHYHSELFFALPNHTQNQIWPFSNLLRRAPARLRFPRSRAHLPDSAGGVRLRQGAGEGVPILSTILAASEGLMGVSLDPTDDGDARYCLVPRAMFFELVPVSADSGETAKMRGGTLLPHEATIGRDYELVITNLGGLYRYRIGDVVRVAGFHGGAVPNVPLDSIAVGAAFALVKIDTDGPDGALLGRFRAFRFGVRFAFGLAVSGRWPRAGGRAVGGTELGGVGFRCFFSTCS